MSCPSCKIKFKKNQRIPYMLSCCDTICSFCINYYTQGYTKEEFECPICCSQTKSLKIEAKNLYPKEDEPTFVNANQGNTSGEFDITIKFLDQSTLSIIVNKNMTVGQLISKVANQKGINENNLRLAFKQVLKDKDKTLEFYKIKDNVTLMEVNRIFGGKSPINS